MLTITAPIVTVTFNPAVDKRTSVEILLPNKKLRCTPYIYEPGGGGINVARALKNLGGEALAIYLVGGSPGIVLKRLLQEEAIKTIAIDTGVDTREDIMIVDRATGLQYRLIAPGNAIGEESWLNCLSALRAIQGIEFLVVSGSLQPGLPDDIFQCLATIAKEKGAKLFIDIPAETIKTHPISNAYLLKPSLDELCVLTGGGPLNGEQIITAARNIIQSQISNIVVVSMGEAGALLVTKDITEKFTAPSIACKSTVGAGDSMLAGIVMQLMAGKSIQESVRFGVACGSAATLNEGTQLCCLEDVMRLYEAMR